MILRVQAIVVSAMLSPWNLAGQHVVEIDLDAGREVFGGPEVGITDHRRVFAIDHIRGRLFFKDAEFPDGIVVLSISTGERVALHTVPRGEGPGELPSGVDGLALAPDGGLYVASVGGRVVEIDSIGEFARSWQTIAGSPAGVVCGFGGRPAVPSLGGLVRRPPRQGQDEEIIGERLAYLLDRAARGDPDPSIRNNREVRDRFLSAKLTCTSDVAYVVRPYGEIDSVAVYRLSGQESRLPVPAEIGEAAVEWEIQGDFSFDFSARINGLSQDGRGNVVMLAIRSYVATVIMDPGSECYALVRYSEDYSGVGLGLRGIHADSALVLHSSTGPGGTDDAGRPVTVVYPTVDRITLNPLRHMEGPPCPGMLPSVESSGG